MEIFIGRFYRKISVLRFLSDDFCRNIFVEIFKGSTSTVALC